MKYVVIDVREPEEFARGHVAGAFNIPPARLLAGAPELSDTALDTPLIVYCRTGSRSNVALNILSGLGYTTITNGVNKEQVEAKFGKTLG